MLLAFLAAFALRHTIHLRRTVREGFQKVASLGIPTTPPPKKQKCETSWNSVFFVAFDMRHASCLEPQTRVGVCAAWTGRESSTLSIVLSLVTRRTKGRTKCPRPLAKQGSARSQQAETETDPCFYNR